MQITFDRFHLAKHVIYAVVYKMTQQYMFLPKCDFHRFAPVLFTCIGMCRILNLGVRIQSAFSTTRLSPTVNSSWLCTFVAAIYTMRRVVEIGGINQQGADRYPSKSYPCQASFNLDGHWWGT